MTVNNAKTIAIGMKWQTHFNIDTVVYTERYQTILCLPDMEMLNRTKCVVVKNTGIFNFNLENCCIISVNFIHTSVWDVKNSKFSNTNFPYDKLQEHIRETILI